MIPFLKKNASTEHYPVSQPSPSPRLWRRGRLGSAQGLVDPWVRRDPSHCKKERRLKAADSTHPRTGCFSCRTEPKRQKSQSVPPKTTSVQLKSSFRLKKAPHLARRALDRSGCRTILSQENALRSKMKYGGHPPLGQLGISFYLCIRICLSCLQESMFSTNAKKAAPHWDDLFKINLRNAYLRLASTKRFSLTWFAALPIRTRM